MQRTRLYDNNGQWVALDERHRIFQEFSGSAEHKWVFRFCGEFVASYRTKKEAKAAALVWEMARVSRLAAACGI